MPRDLDLRIPPSSSAQALSLTARIYGYDPGDGATLPDAVESCYHELFPIVEERDSFADMRIWLDAADLNPKIDYRELLAVLYSGGKPVGLAYFTVYPVEGWAF